MMERKRWRQPRSTEAAATMLERYAALDSEARVVGAARDEAIAKANAEADAQLVDNVAERAEIEAKLAPWWAKDGEGLIAKVSGGKRKSIELGGCMIGTRAGRSSLAIVGDEKDVVEVMGALRWAKPFLRCRVSLDKTAVLKGLDGPKGPQLAELGLERDDGAPVFFVTPTAQGGTLS